MAQGKPARKEFEDVADDASKYWTQTWVAFVNIDLSKAQKEEFKHWAEKVDLELTLARHFDIGRAFSFKVDAKQNCGIATCLERDKRSPNAGLMVSARGASPFLALYRVAYIVDVVLDGVKWKAAGTEYDADRW